MFVCICMGVYVLWDFKYKDYMYKVPQCLFPGDKALLSTS